jgi:hypothetical protein
VGRALAHDAAEKAVKSRIAAETGLQDGLNERVACAVVLDAEKAFDTLSLAEGGEANAGLALEEAAEGRRGS